MNEKGVFNFGDEYHWRERTGPLSKRPVRINTQLGALGTYAFMDFAELTAPAGTLADLMATWACRGQAQPIAVSQDWLFCKIHLQFYKFAFVLCRKMRNGSSW